MKRSVCAALALILAGCGTPRLPELNVEQQWSDAMRRLGLFAFYPATEDVRPGDIYLLVPPPSGAEPWFGQVADSVIPWSQQDHDGSRFSLLRMANLDGRPQVDPRRPPAAPMSVLDHLRAQQDERFRIQPLPREEDVLPAGQRRPAGQPRTERITDAPPADAPFRVGHADQVSLPLRLQRSAIPALTVARLTEGQVAGAGIFGNFGANLGLSSSNDIALTIALRDVQEINLDAWRVRALYDAHAHATLRDRVTPNDMMLWLGVLRGGRNWRYDLVDEACNGDTEYLRRQGVQVAVVTRVIYAGAIEYSFSRRLATAVQAAVDLQGTLAQNIRQAPQVPAAVVVNNNSGSGAGSGAGQQQTPPTPPAAQLRDAIAARLSGLTGVTTGENGRAGVRTSFGIGTLGALSLTETFNRPIAVGAGSRLRLAFHQVLAGEEASKEIAEGPLSLQTQLTERFRAAEDYCLSHFQMRGRRDFDRIGLWSAMSGGDRTPPERPNLSGGTERALLLQTPPRPNSRVLRAP